MASAQPDPFPKRHAASRDSASGPTVLRITLGSHLRRLREARGLSREAAGDAIRGSHAKISRLELGQVRVKPRDLDDLLTLYGVDETEQRQPLLDLAERASAPGWWHAYGDVLPAWFENYVGLEQAAILIRTYEAQFVPGLLQTADYARAVVRLGYPCRTDDEVHQRVELRRHRQELLTRTAPPTLWAVLDEAALRRPVGGTDVMRAQIDHVLAVGEQPHVTLQLVPLHAGGHAAAGGPFTLLRFAEPDLGDLVYLEQLTTARYLDKPHDVEDYQAIMEQLAVQAYTPADTTTALRALRRDL